MKAEQFSEYRRISEEVEPVKKFLVNCGTRYREKGRIKMQFRLVCRGVAMGLCRIFHLNSVEENLFFDIPQDLQARIIDVMENWVAEKEEELSKI